jgi:hypothetical protein
MSAGLTVAQANRNLAKDARALQSGRMATIDTTRGRIGLIDTGRDDAKPILFLHGVGSDKSVWRPQLDHFGPTR